MKNSPRITYFASHYLFKLLEQAETEIDFLQENPKFKIKLTLDRRGPRPIPNYSRLCDPPSFSLLSTFKRLEKDNNNNKISKNFVVSTV